MFVRDSISDADREQYGDYLDDIFSVTRQAIIDSRSWTSEEFDTALNDGFLYSPKSALEQNLVDAVGREKAVKEAVNELEGSEVKKYFVYGNSEFCITESKLVYSAGSSRGLNIIAVVNANGQTDMERGMAARKTARTIRQLAEQRNIKAIVVRINSPGGSAEAADYVAEAIKFAKEKKPVVVSMGAVAGSGGYWAAMYASEIIASPYTLTGSIGVIGSWFFDNGLNNKLGLSVDVLKRGDHSDIATGMILPYRDLDDEEIERYRVLLMDMYNNFVSKVAFGRNMEIEKVEALAQGHVYSGMRALEIGLIDKIGGFSDAIQSAKKLAGISEKAKVSIQ
jgi:protease-4